MNSIIDQQGEMMDMFDKTVLKVVTLESPVDFWDQTVVRQLFSNIVELKVAGYSQGYQKLGYKVLPVDGTDFIGIHQLVCRQDGERLVPLMGYRSISLSRCNEYNMVFPFLSAVSACDSQYHIDAVRSIVKEMEEDKLNICYDSAFTISPELKGNIELEMFVYELLFMIVGMHRKDYGADRTFVLANEGFKTDKLFKKMGSQILQYQDEELSSIVLPFSGYNKHKILVCDNSFTLKSKRYMRDHKAMWEDRMIIGADQLGIKKAA